jgi:uncharacterized coiled-coil DUF342 family protein
MRNGNGDRLTELDAFILALDDEMKKGARAERALRTVVTERAEQIRERIKEDEGFGD